ncbi:MAG: methyltransferase domain-containing protein [Planctomycetaceae bacterium]|nr:methyltransferase domain-containing protein [Planctomycetaceae bacterium]
MVSNRWNRFVYRLWAPIYDQLVRRHPVARIRRTALEQIGATTAQTVLLTGVGTGEDLQYLPSACRVIGVDFSTAMLRRSIRKAKAAELCFTGLCSDVTEIPLRSESCDAAALILIVSVVPEPRLCIEESLRTLTPGSRMVIVDKFLSDDRRIPLFRRLLNLLTRPFGTDINRQWKDVCPASAVVLSDKPVGLWGSLRMIILQKPFAPENQPVAGRHHD